MAVITAASPACWTTASGTSAAFTNGDRGVLGENIPREDGLDVGVLVGLSKFSMDSEDLGRGVFAAAVGGFSTACPTRAATLWWTGDA